MSLLRRLVPLFLFLSAATLSYGAAAPHHAVAISATVYTYTVSGTSSATLHSTKVDNRTILSSLVTSGSVTGVAASDLDIVLGSNPPELDVINKNTLTPVYTLAKTGTAGSTSSTVIYGTVAHKVTFRETILDYEFVFPEMDVFKTGTIFTATVIHDATMIDALSQSFSGGSGETQIIGRSHTTSKVYTY